MLDAIFLGVAAAVLGTAAIKARGTHGAERPAALGAFCRFLVALGLAFVFLSPAAERLESRVVANLGRLLANTSTLVAAYAIGCMLLHLNHPPGQVAARVRPRRVALVVSVAVMTVLFLSTPTGTPGQSPTGAFGHLVATQPALGVYVLVYCGYLGVALVDLRRLAWRYAGYAGHRPFLRPGLRVMAGGCALGLVYVGEKALAVIWQWASLPGLPNGEVPCTSPVTPAGCAFSITLPAVAALVIVTGATLPALGPVCCESTRWARDWYRNHQLRPLWMAIRRAVPEIVLVAPPASRSPRGPRFRLYRRVIEIRDGCLAVRALRDPAVAERAARDAREAGLTGDRARAAVEAAVLAAALEARREGARDLGLPADAPPDGVPPDPVGLSEEIAWLSKVSAAFAHTPPVPSALDTEPEVHT